MAKTKTEESEDDVVLPQSFGVFLSKLADGEVMLDAGTELQKCVEAIEGLEGKGTAVLTVKLTMKRESNGTVDVIAETTTKLPKLPASRTVFWVDSKTGHLVSENPRQQKLPLRDVAPAPVLRGAKDAINDG